MRTTAARHRAGFTLVELLIVVVLMAILSLIALPQIKSERQQAVLVTLGSNVQQVTMVLEVQKQKLGDDAWPASILPQWFTSGILPKHPDQMADVPLIETVSHPSYLHPRDKIVQPGSPGAYWYNSQLGGFRARVKDQGSSAATLDFYNQVNQCSLASLSHTGAGGGAGGGVAVIAGGGGSALGGAGGR